MGNSAIGRGTAVEENKVKASSGDGSPNFLDSKVDDSTIEVASNQIIVKDKGITTAKRADGTDGEIPTWDASGVASNVAVGTVGQVLTSGGAGVAPTMQTPAGGGALELISNTVLSTANTGNIAIVPNAHYRVLVNLNLPTTTSAIRMRVNSLSTSIYKWYARLATYVVSPVIIESGDNSDTSIRFDNAANTNAVHSMDFTIDTNVVGTRTLFMMGTAHYDNQYSMFSGAVTSAITVADFEFFVDGPDTMVGNILLYKYAEV